MFVPDTITPYTVIQVATSLFYQDQTSVAQQPNSCSLQYQKLWYMLSKNIKKYVSQVSSPTY